MKAEYVKTDRGLYLIHVENPESEWGFYLCDDDQSWDGGFGIATSWEYVEEEEVPDEVKEELGWIIEETNMEID